MTEIIDFFNQLAASWDTTVPVNADRIRYLISLLSLSPGDRVLDVGCGTGVLEDFLPRDIRLTAMDFSPEMIKVAKAKHPDVNYVVADFLEVDGEALYDKIIMYNVFPHFIERERAIKKAHQLLGPHGMLLICHGAGRSVINTRHSGLKSNISRSLPTTEEFKTLLTPLFNIVLAEDREEYFAIKGIKN